MHTCTHVRTTCAHTYAHTHSICHRDDSMSPVGTHDCTSRANGHLIVLTEILQQLCGVGVAHRRRTESLTRRDAGMPPQNIGARMHTLRGKRGRVCHTEIWYGCHYRQVELSLMMLSPSPVLRPRPAFRCFQYRKAGEGLE